MKPLLSDVILTLRHRSWGYLSETNTLPLTCEGILFLYVTYRTGDFFCTLMWTKLVSLCEHVDISSFPPWLFVSGYVESVDRKANSFQLSVFQWVEGGSFRDKLTINALLNSSTRSPTPGARMPKAKGMVSFTGIVQQIQGTAVTVVAETMTYLNNKARPPCYGPVGRRR